MDSAARAQSAPNRRLRRAAAKPAPVAPTRGLREEDLGALNSAEVVMQFFGYSRTTLSREIAAGRLRPLKLAEGGSSRLRFTRKEILRRLSEMESGL